jgi:hypothetical protein
MKLVREHWMKVTNLVKGAVVTLAALGMVMPQGQVEAATGLKGIKAVKTVEASVADISLANGALTGRVVDHTGAAMASKEVVVRQGKNEVAMVKTDKSGTFVVSNLKGGLYEVTAGTCTGTFRVWTESAAPSSAAEQALLVVGENGVRGGSGSFGGNGFGGIMGDGTLVLTAAVIAAVIMSGIALGKLNDLQDDVDNIPKSP